MAIDSRIILAGKSPDIGAAFSNALLNVQRGQQIAQTREQSGLNREQLALEGEQFEQDRAQGIIRNRLLEAQAGQAEQGAIESEQVNNIRSLALFGQDIAGDTSMESIRAKTLQRISDVTGRGGNPSDSQELLATVIDNPNLTDEQKIAEVRLLSQMANDKAIQFGALKAPTAASRAKFIGTPQRISRQVLDPATGKMVSKNFLSGVVQQKDGTFKREDVPVDGRFLSTLGETPEQEVETEVQKQKRLAALELKTRPEIEGTVETARGKAQIKTEDIKQVAKINNSRIAELNQGGKARTSSTRKAKQFLRAIKDGKAFTGATRAAAQFIPGVFTTQAEFDEKFNAFSEVAARQKLKATGEIRPTDADVEGMKRAIFGVGRDENVNIQLLEEFISDQDDIDNELDDLLAAKRGGNIGTFTKAVKPEDLVKLTDEELLDF